MTLQPPTPNTDRLSDFIVYCPIEKSLLVVLRRFVNCVAEDMGFSEDDQMKIEMAVDEACSNIVLHAYGEPAQQIQNGIELRMSMEPGSLTIQIQDRGKGSPAEKEFRGVESIEDYQKLDRKEFRGLGILIMKGFMDEVQFKAEPNAGTQVTMRKFLPARQSGRAAGAAGIQA